MDDIEFIDAQQEIKTLKISSNDTLEIVLDKLQRCQDFGLKAKAIFNGTEFNNYENFDYQAILNKLQEIKKTLPGYNPNIDFKVNREDTTYINDEKTISEVGEIKLTKVQEEVVSEDTLLENETPSATNSSKESQIVQSLEVKPEESIEVVAQKLEICKEKGIDAIAVVNGIEVSNRQTTNKEDIKKEYQEKYDLEKDLKDQGIEFMPPKNRRYITTSRQEARLLRLKKNDTIWTVIEKLQICAQKGILIWVEFNGVELNNYEFNFKRKLNDKYYLKSIYDKQFNENRKLVQELEKQLGIVNYQFSNDSSAPTRNLGVNYKDNLRKYILDLREQVINKNRDNGNIAQANVTLTNDVTQANLDANNVGNNKRFFNNQEISISEFIPGINSSTLSTPINSANILNLFPELKTNNNVSVNDQTNINIKDRNTTKVGMETSVSNTQDRQNKGLPIKQKQSQENNIMPQFRNNKAQKVGIDTRLEDLKLSNPQAVASPKRVNFDLKNKRNRLLYNPNQRHFMMGSPNPDLIEEDSLNEEEINEENNGLEESSTTLEGENEASQLENNQGENNQVEAKSPVSTSTTTNATNNNSSNNKIKNVKKTTNKLATTTKMLKFFLKYKWLILIGGGIIIFFFFILLFFYGSDVQTSDSEFGLNGYAYYEVEGLCKTVTVYNHDRTQYSKELDFETEYIPGVLYREVRGFSDSPEAMKLFAIAARTYALSRLSKDCTIEGSTYAQSFEFDENILNEITQPGHALRDAADATHGLILVRDGAINTAYYDAGCYRKEDDNYYYFGYGINTIGSEQLQPIPKSWVESHSGLMSYVNKTKARNDGKCENGHARGFSQYGAYYLAQEEGYNFKDLVNYYFKDTEINSLYPGISNNYIIATSSGANDQLTQSLRDFLKTQGLTPEAYNEYILKNVVEAGVGTREAVVAAATSLVGGLYQNYNIRIPYTFSGLHGGSIPNYAGQNINHVSTSFYGVDPEWGSLIRNSNDNLFHYDNYTYSRYGPDCSGFVSWALHNAGFMASDHSSGTEGDYGTKHALTGTRVGDPGDLMWHKGHIMLIVGVDDEAKLYYIAHAYGGSDGTIISTISFTDKKNFAVDMDEWYETHRLNISTEEFIAQFRAGYIDGYTGAYDMDFNLGMSEESTYFVGDSRTVGVCNATYKCTNQDTCDNSSCLASVGKSYSWFNENMNKISSINAHKIIINMGVNDLVGLTDGKGTAEKYFKNFETLAKNNPNKIFYIESITPVEDGTVKKSAVESFNSNIRSLINNANYKNLKYLNTYQAIDYNIANDGIHYDNATYKNLYDYIMGEI